MTQAYADSEIQDTHDSQPLDTASDNSFSTGGAKAPKGFVKRSDELQGYYHHRKSGGINFIARSCKLFDAKTRKNEAPKSSTLVICELLEEALLESAVKDEGMKKFPAGTAFGIWTKPGMRELKLWANQPVFMICTGTRDVGAQSPMWTFEIQSADGAKMERLKVTEDKRDKSLPDSLRAKRAEVEREQSDDEIPF